MDRPKGDGRRIKEHFDEEASGYDDIVVKLAPRYELFLDALVQAIPFEANVPIEVVDLGCGTGNVTIEVKKRFHDAEIICVDLAGKMLSEAKEKHKGLSGITYYECDVRNFNFDPKPDAVLSSLCLHHISNVNEKKDFYKKVYSSLKEDGVFLINDIILGSTPDLDNLYLEKWKEFMLKNISEEEAASWMKKHESEDTPFKLIDELKWLEEAGFKEIDVICKHYNVAVYGGMK